MIFNIFITEFREFVAAERFTDIGPFMELNRLPCGSLAADKIVVGLGRAGEGERESGRKRKNRCSDPKGVANDSYQYKREVLNFFKFIFTCLEKKGGFL